MIKTMYICDLCGKVIPNLESTSINGVIVSRQLQFLGKRYDLCDDCIKIVENATKQARSGTLTVEDLDLSIRSYNLLKRAGLNTVTDIQTKTKEEMMQVRNMGKKSLKEIETKLIDMTGVGFLDEADLYEKIVEDWEKENERV